MKPHTTPSGAGRSSTLNTLLATTHSFGLVLGAILGLAPAASHAQSELIRNGTFDDVLANWTLPSALEGDSPYVYEAPEEYVNLHPSVMEYTGTLLRQNLNVPGIADQTINASLDLRVDWPITGQTIQLTVEFSRSDGSLAHATVLAPDNAAIGDVFTTFTDSYTFPSDGDRLLAVTIDKTSWGDIYGDNISLTSSLVPEALPMIGSVSPSRLPYGDTIQISGSDFGATQGSVLIGGSNSGVAIDSWSDTLIQVTVNDPCPGGLLTVVLPNKVRCNEAYEIGITSPHFTATRFQPSSFDPVLDTPIAVPGQIVYVNVDVDCHNGCAPVGGITFSVPEAPTALIHPTHIAADGGSRIGIDTSGLTPGIHNFTITASATDFAPRTFPLSIDVRTPGTLTLNYRDSSYNWIPVPDPFVLTSQDKVVIQATLLDDADNDITQYVDFTYSTSNQSVVQAWNPTIAWDDPVIMPQDNGSCVLSVNGPGSINGSYSVTVTIPDHPKIVDFTITPTDSFIDNSGDSIFTINVTASEPMISFGTSQSRSFAESIDSSWSNGNRSYTATYKVYKDTAPGKYTFEVTATIAGGGANRTQNVIVINTPTTGMITGYQALMRDPTYSHGATGTLEFYDSTTGTKSFEREMPWSEWWDYSLTNIPPGTYKLRWRTEIGPGYPAPQWFGNTYDIDSATVVVITAGSTVTDKNFFLDLIPDTLSPSPSPSTPQFSSSSQQFSCTTPAEDGFEYELWKSNSLLGGSWYKVGTLDISGGVVTFTDSAAMDPQAFYKIIRK